MNSGHVIGYVGGLAVALGVGAAVTLGSPTAAADAASPSDHTASASTAKSARMSPRATAVGSIRRAPMHKAGAPTPSATLLMTASAAADPRRSTAAVRAAATPIDSGHSLVVDTAADGSGGVTTRVTVHDNGTHTQVGSTVTLGGTPSAQLITADGNRAMVTAESTNLAVPYTSQVAVVDMHTGSQIGTTLVLDGRPAGPQPVGSDGTHIVVMTEVYSQSGDSTHVTLINTVSGTQTGPTLVLAGRLSQDPLLDVTGDHALITTRREDGSNGYVSQVAVIDTRTGTQAGTTLTFAGSSRVEFVGDNSVALISSYTYDPATGGTSRFTVLNATTGLEVGTALTLDGSPWDTPAVSTDGTNLLVIATRQDPVTGSSTVNAAVLDTAIGTQTGHTLALDGALKHNPVAGAAGTYVFITGTTNGTTHIGVLDSISGEQRGATVDIAGWFGQAVRNADGTHVLITTGDGVSTRVAVVDSTTGDQAGPTLALIGSSGPPLLSADGVHALVTASTAGSTQIAVVDTSTGAHTGTTLTLTGTVTGPLVNADGIHALFAASTGNSTQILIVDTTTGAQTGTTVGLTGAMGYALADADYTHVLVTTTDGNSTSFTVVDSATGRQTGASLTFSGQLVAWPPPATAADGTHALFLVADADQTQVVLVDITTGAQTGTTLTLPGTASVPIVTDGGSHTTIITRLPANGSHGSSTHLAVIDTATGLQVGGTTRLTGTPVALAELSADGRRIKVKTTAGLRASLDPTTGAADVSAEGFPWGFDLEAFALTPLGRLVTAIQTVVATIQLGLVALVFNAYLLLAGLFYSLQNHQAAATPAAPLTYHNHL